ncbi:MmcQ/YjbR family DNA-binding protein [Aeromonas hydrophila]|uniref:MmcQ/YjbR family DNA-binding protein n=1 Tax=Aeromonas hydrophila TaxID=644 RepID=A0A926IZ49_AERHY|nr:MmcQ/YjbR family DNA-binding protein [Aeromonas hydrophila]
MFALLDWQAEPLRLNLARTRAGPAAARTPPEVKPGWHMNKQHWNTVTFSDGLADDLWQGWVHHSYERVVAGLPKAKRPQAPQR